MRLAPYARCEVVFTALVCSSDQSCCAARAGDILVYTICCVPVRIPPSGGAPRASTPTTGVGEGRAFTGDLFPQSSKTGRIESLEPQDRFDGGATDHVCSGGVDVVEGVVGDQALQW